MGKGPKRDKSTGRFVARRSLTEKIFGHKGKTGNTDRVSKDVVPGKRRKTDGIVTEPLKVKRVKCGKHTASIRFADPL